MSVKIGCWPWKRERGLADKYYNWYSHTRSPSHLFHVESPLSRNYWFSLGCTSGSACLDFDVILDGFFGQSRQLKASSGYPYLGRIYRLSMSFGILVYGFDLWSFLGLIKKNWWKRAKTVWTYRRTLNQEDCQLYLDPIQSAMNHYWCIFWSAQSSSDSVDTCLVSVGQRSSASGCLAGQSAPGKWVFNFQIHFSKWSFVLASCLVQTVPSLTFVLFWSAYWEF